MEQIRVVVCGEKRVAEECLEFLSQREDTQVCGIVAAAKDWQADLIKWGAKRRLKVFVGNINDYFEEIYGMRPHFIFSIQYRPLIKQRILDIPTRGCINLHFGLLPHYSGCYPVAWAILNGEEYAGATLHYMTPTFDEGNVIAQKRVNIGCDTTARTLYDMISTAARELFVETYPALVDGHAASTAQDLSSRVYYSKDSIDFARDSMIDWSRPAALIQRRICAFSFEPFQLPLTFLRLPSGQEISTTVAHSRVCDCHCDDSVGVPGQLIKVTEAGSVIVSTGDGGCIEIGQMNKQLPRELLMSLGYSLRDMRLVGGGEK